VPGKDCQDRNPRKDFPDRATRTGLLGEDSQGRAERRGYPGKVRQNSTAGTGQPIMKPGIKSGKY
jgi:hypothetical protein